MDKDAILLPRTYQSDALQVACAQNTVIRMDTGSGKTLVAVMLLRYFTSQPVVSGRPSKLAFFIVPTASLVEQQGNVVRNQTSLNTLTFRGADGVDFWNREKWQEQLEPAHVVVCTPQILLDLLRHSFWSLERTSLLIFDEAHHAVKKHPYNLIMKEFYHANPGSPYLPHIFGMTASPMWNPKNPRKSLESLESNLASQVFEVISSDLEKATHRPVEILRTYLPITVNEISPIEALFNASGPAPEKFVQQLALMKDELGLLAGDCFIFATLRALTRPYGSPYNGAGLNLEDFVGDTDTSSLYKPILEKVMNLLPDRVIDRTRLLSPKLEQLVEVLVSFEKVDSFQAIIFVDRRAHALVLADLFPRVPQLASWTKVEYLVGHGSEGSRAQPNGGMFIKEQERVVQRFRAHQTNILVATKVAEEGLDFRNCNLVVRIDPIQNFTGYVQSRGRARSANSQFVVIAQEGVDADRYRSYVATEPGLKAIYSPEDRAAEDVDEPDLEDLPMYTVDSTKARLTHDSAIPLLSAFCSMLPQDEFTNPPAPAFEEVGSTGSAFVSKLQLPIIASLSPDERIFQSVPLPTKRAAKQNAAYQACIVLHKSGALDDYLVPVRETRTGPDANGREIKPDFPPHLKIRFQHAFGNIWCEESEIWLHVVQVGDLGVVGLVCGRRLPPVSKTSIFDTSPTQEFSVSLLLPPSRLEFDNNTLRLSQLDNLNRTCIMVAMNKRIDDATLFALWAPLTPSMLIDWDQIENSFPPVDASTLRPGEIVYIPFKRFTARTFSVVKVRTDVNAVSPTALVETNPGPGRKQLILQYPIYPAYAKVAFGVAVETSSPESILELEMVSIFNQHNSLTRPALSSSPSPPSLSSKDRKIRNYPESACKRSTLPPSWWKIILLSPSLIRIIEDRTRAQDLLDHFHFPPINIELLVKALTLPSASTGYNYQSLETLGDSVLKVLTTVHVYLAFPKLDEGRLGVVRQNSIDNRFLRRRCVDSGLCSFVLPDLYRPRQWCPSTSKRAKECELSPDGLSFERFVGRKSLSDTVEAVLGAAYLTGGLKAALAVGDKLELCFGGILPWPERKSAKALLTERWDTPQGLLKIEERIGYKFQNAKLLQRALTHRSFLAPSTNCYEREEHLGDALLDFWVTDTIWSLFPDSDPRRLTFLRALLVSNVTLAFLSLRVLEAQKNVLHNSPPLQAAMNFAAEESERLSWEQILIDLTWTFDAPKVLGDVFEAVLGAVFVDSGFDIDVVSKVLEGLYGEILPLVLSDREIRDPYTQLFQLAQRKKCKRLKITTTYQPELKKRFEAICTFHDTILVVTRSSAKAVSRHLAAREAFEKLGISEEGEELWATCDCKLKDDGPLGDKFEEEGESTGVEEAKESGNEPIAIKLEPEDEE